ncbi:hypothetical protein [Winogradskyella haliclonae]|uniref:Thaumarchaeal output domain-containing protein n=1 Tax=Winogradskyella haliclonae TaxID=2048558 RepID=A0ABQ2BUP9_9FLAO|nr:hypothetical protein [Winogradskyella haliclonae]GGI56170.1 hypothetical protein GCM10011444_04790 [Winogradskyella haliclonae]
MFNVLRNSDSAKELVYQGVRLVLVRRVTELQQQWRDYNGLIIDTAIEHEAKAIVEAVRRAKGIESLIPLFINDIQDFPRELVCHTDGFIDTQHQENVAHKTIAINKRLAQIMVKDSSNFDEEIKYKTLGFIYSRNQIFAPFTSRVSRIGYHFPLLSLYYKNEEKTLLKILESLEKQGYIAKTFRDHIHLCKSCDSNYLNFKEICSSCKSADIQARDMIHHFVCAHVAPENDFKTEDGLSCPKCDKHLRHIGIDYDKPSSIFSCNSCANEFQNPEMQASCFDCDTDNTLSELLQKTIGDYSISAHGEQWLFDMQSPLKKQIETSEIDDGTIPISIFKVLLKQEVKRILTTGITSQFVTIQYENAQFKTLNETMQHALKTEIAEIIRSYLLPSDIMTVQDYNLFHIFIPDTKNPYPERIEHIDYNLNKLLNDNIKKEKSPITVTKTALNSNTKIDTLFNYKDLSQC